MNVKKRSSLPTPPTQKSSKTHCNTKQIIITFRVTPKQWAYLLEKSGGNISKFIRRKLGLEKQV